MERRSDFLFAAQMPPPNSWANLLLITLLSVLSKVRGDLSLQNDTARMTRPLLKTAGEVNFRAELDGPGDGGEVVDFGARFLFEVDQGPEET